MKRALVLVLGLVSGLLSGGPAHAADVDLGIALVSASASGDTWTCRTLAQAPQYTVNGSVMAQGVGTSECDNRLTSMHLHVRLYCYGSNPANPSPTACGTLADNYSYTTSVTGASWRPVTGSGNLVRTHTAVVLTFPVPVQVVQGSCISLNATQVACYAVSTSSIPT